MSATFIDASGNVRLQGTLVGAGGVTECGVYSGASKSIADGAQDLLPWSFFDDGDAVLDISNTVSPVVVASGVYAVTVCVRTLAMTSGGTYRFSLVLDTTGFAPSVEGDAPPASAAQTTPDVTLAMTKYIPAGSGIATLVENLDGAAARFFAIQRAVCQRIS
jgi:hypothetical protein